MREALRAILGVVHWRALVAAWILTLLAVGVLVATDAPPVITSMVIGGLAAIVAWTIVGETFVPIWTGSRSQEPKAAPVVRDRPLSARRVPDGSGSVRVAANIRRLREERCWSQEMLAGCAGLRSTEVSQLERGVGEPRLMTVLAVAEALEVPVSDLVSDPGERSADPPTTRRRLGG